MHHIIIIILIFIYDMISDVANTVTHYSNEYYLSVAYLTYIVDIIW